MKRTRESTESKSEICSAIEELSVLVKPKSNPKPNFKPKHKPKAPPPPSPVVVAAGGQGSAGSGGDDIQDCPRCFPTRPFLCLCDLIIQILDKIGPSLAVLRRDISQNIQRLEKWWQADPETNSNLVEILKSEAVRGNARKGDSCSRALLWLTRSLDLTAVMLQKLASDPGQIMEELVEESYKLTLKPWHGWISATAYKVALKLLPDTKSFLDLLMANGEELDTLKNDIQTLNSLLMPFLEDIHSILRSFGLDRLKSP